MYLEHIGAKGGAKDQPTRFGVRGCHNMVFCVALPAWTKPALVDTMVSSVRSKLSEEVCAMLLVVEPNSDESKDDRCSSISSEQSDGSLSPSMTSTTSSVTTSGGHAFDVGQ